MKGINKVILLGLLGQDPEVRYTASGTCVTTFSIATNEQYKDKRTGEKVEKAVWHNCVGFAKTGEIIGEYFKKGMKVYIEGSIDHQKYEKEGETKYITKIIVKDFIMLSSVEGQKNEPHNHNKQNTQKQSTTHEYNQDLVDDLDVPF